MKIYWTESAVEDLNGIKGYIARDSEYYAINFTDKIISSVEQLALLPELGRNVPEADEEIFSNVVYEIFCKIFVPFRFLIFRRL